MRIAKKFRSICRIKNGIAEIPFPSRRYYDYSTFDFRCVVDNFSKHSSHMLCLSPTLIYAHIWASKTPRTSVGTYTLNYRNNSCSVCVRACGRVCPCGHTRNFWHPCTQIKKPGLTKVGHTLESDTFLASGLFIIMAMLKGHLRNYLLQWKH